MRRWRFAFSRRWLGYLAFAIVFAIACVLLSNWQLARGKEAAAANALVSRNFDSSPIALSDALPSTTSFRADQEWLRVRVTGVYQPADQLLVRNRTTDTGPGFEVLTPVKTADGALFIVDRGWVAVGDRGNLPETVPPPPAGTVTLVARLKPGEPRLPGQTASGNQVPTIELHDIRAALKADVYVGAYGLLESQTPASAPGLTPVVTSKPVEDEGLHWSYMIQWIIFALIGFFGLGYAVWQEYKHRNEDDPALRERVEAYERRRARRAKSDAEVEDQLLDAR
jgi:cytochrome oxidase assembly protein ShyY1